jgi:NAD(P)H-flavin reductase/hemoglobin-like flavoprotein
MDPARLKDSWHAVSAHGDQVPLFFYSSLFLMHPETRDLFPASMATQRDRLVRALGKVISNVDELDSVVPVLQQLGRDHRKFGATPAHYPAVGKALLGTLEEFLGEHWTPELAADWTAAFGVVSKVMIDAAEAAAADSPPWWDAEIVSHEQRIVDVAVLHLRPNYRLPYRPGQAISLETPVRPRLWRFYSPANMPAEDGLIELHVRSVDGGPVSGVLVQSTSVGDTVRLGSPVGEGLTLDPGSTSDLVLIAGGTGLAPMKALIGQVAAEGGKRQVHLYWGARWSFELYDLEALRKLEAEHDWLHVVPCVSVDTTYEGVRDTAVGGALAAWPEQAGITTGGGPWPDREIYLCGSPGMVRASLDALRDAGVPRSRVHVESFGDEEELR